MESKLQEGIFYRSESKIGKSCYIIFIRVGKGSTPLEVSKVLTELWGMFKNLKEGVVIDLKEVNSKHLYTGNMSVLIGYGHRIFLMNNLKKNKPYNLSDVFSFDEPRPSGGGPVTRGSKVVYSDKITTNHATMEDIVLQIIGDNDFVTSRATVETWKVLSGLQNSSGNDTLYISRVYTGFQREDNRSWLGFHDGVSNIPTKFRLGIISVKSDDVRVSDLWTVGGTYMGFLRIEIDLKSWIKFNADDQSKIIGRDKITGCPLIGIDKNKKPVKSSNCPVRGTFEVIERGNEIYRDHVPFGRQSYIPPGVSDKMLENSHVGRANPINASIQLSKINSYSIFRQGFQFFEPMNRFPGFRVGLNFVSYQNNPSRLINILGHGFGRYNLGHDSYDLPSFETFFSVWAAGFFFVPPLERNQKFPGVNIFFDDSSRSYLAKLK